MQKLSKLATALIVGAMMSATAMAAGKAFVTVNGTAVSQSIADVFISEQKAKGAPDSAELKNAVREELIRRELLVQEAKKAEFFKSFDVLADTVKRWDDAVTLASSTPRMSLPERIADLQKIKQDTEGLMVSLCLSTPKSILLRSMGSTIDGFLIFLHNEDHMGDLLSSVPIPRPQRSTL